MKTEFTDPKECLDYLAEFLPVVALAKGFKEGWYAYFDEIPCKDEGCKYWRNDTCVGGGSRRTSLAALRVSLKSDVHWADSLVVKERIPTDEDAKKRPWVKVDELGVRGIRQLVGILHRKFITYHKDFGACAWNKCVLATPQECEAAGVEYVPV